MMFTIGVQLFRSAHLLRPWRFSGMALRFFSRLWIASATAFTLLAVHGNALAAPSAAGTLVDPGRGWWLLLPAALGVGSWLWLNSHEQPIGQPVFSRNPVTTPPPEPSHRAEAAASEGVVAIHQRPDPGAPVLREIRNGGVFRITGARRRDARREEWLEVSGGGWVRDGETRYDRNIVR